MGSGAAEDADEKPELSADTVKLGEDEPDRKTPYIGTYLYNDHDDEDDARHALAHQRSPGLWLPLVIFVVLLVAGVAIGRYLWPSTGSAAVTSPSAVTSSTPPATGGAGPPSLHPWPSLPTPPARPADALASWAGSVGAAIDVPPIAMAAYGYAQLLLQRSDPGCHLGWTTLAGIGEVASRHGRADGATLQDSGRSLPTVVGPLLNGKSGQPLVKDTDAGAYDGDATFDRAMGPLLIMPALWRAHASDADADGILDPYDIDDAALAVGKILCAGNEDLNDLAGWKAAIGRHTSGETFAKAVFSAADSYGQRTARIQ